MKFIIVSVEWCNNKGIVIPVSARRSIDGSEVIFHKDFLEPVLTEKDTIKEYSYDSQELRDILDSDKWTSKEETNEI